MRYISKFWLWLSIMCVIITVIFLRNIPELLQMRQLITEGKMVNVAIVRRQNVNLGKRSASFLTFNFQGQEHTMRVSRTFLDQTHNLKSVELLHSYNYPSAFLTSDTNVEHDFFVCIFLIFLFVVAGMVSFAMLRKST